MTTEFARPVEIAFRIPGKWGHPRDLIQLLPEGYQLTPDTFTFPDGTELGFGAVRADKQFAQIFRSSCRQPPTDDELATVAGYTINAFLMGPGGSLQSAHKMMQAAAVIVRAGGAGVFIDNCALAHGGKRWLDLTDDGGPDALSFAFTAIIRGNTEVYTMGLHVLGLRDIVMNRADIETDGFDIIEVIRYLARSDKPVDDGHLIADENGPRFRALAQESPSNFAGSPMHNPFGRLKLVRIAETN